MEKAFWLNRWAEQRIGFHLPDVNPHLRRYWPGLGLPPGSRVLVPLCGKSLDMIWLREQGHEVLGVEFSERAIRDFSKENGLDLELREENVFNCARARGLTLLQGDFFQLDAQRAGDIVAVYDRAALVALPRDMRSRYVDRVMQLLQPGSKLLLVSMDYAEGQRQGPPFRVPADEVRTLYEPGFRVELLESVPPESGGGDEVLEQIWRMRRR